MALSLKTLTVRLMGSKDRSDAEHPRRRRARWAAAGAGAILVAVGGGAVAVAASAQTHAPQPGAAQAGTLGPLPPPRPADAPGNRSVLPEHVVAPAGPDSPAATEGPVLARSVPVSIAIPSIGVHSVVQQVGLNPDGTIQTPPLDNSPQTNQAAWYKFSPTPGQVGPSIIEGHVDSAAQGPSVFFHLGEMKPGQTVDVTLQDGVVATFKVDGVREYLKAEFPTATVYGSVPYAGLRLVTCGGSFDGSTGHYLSNVVVFASLVSSHPS